MLWFGLGCRVCLGLVVRRVEGDADELVVAALAHVAHEDLVRGRLSVRVGSRVGLGLGLGFGLGLGSGL